MFIKTFIGILVIKGILSQQQPACEQGSCYPATGDLLIGRADKLWSSSTCGLNERERFCIVSHLEDTTKCFQCDSRQPYDKDHYPNSHRVENVVSSFKGRKDRWWQAENGKEHTTIRLDLEAEFHFTHLIMTFKTFRPAAMLIERSSDFGKTWKVYRYFAYDCASSFPGVGQGPVRNITEVICETRYSNVAPSTEGEVIFRVLPPSVEIKDPYSEAVQDLLKMTNLRINFTKLHTLGDNLLDSRDEIEEKYYYSIYDMVVRGSCSCYGHASRCLPIDGKEIPNSGDMVHGQCQCTHNTKGNNCEKCDDFYHDLPWRPARNTEPNACKRCECNDHDTSCHFDPAIYEATGRVSGGVCDQCQDNTMGRNCQECRPFFYQDPNLDIRHPQICKPCNCDPAGSENRGECDSKTDPDLNLVAGRCICKRHVDGQRCDYCKNGYWNLQDANPDGCQECSCNLLGTVGNYGCDKYTGECRCKRYVTGRDCDVCVPKYWGLSEDPDGCKPCECDIGGAFNRDCDQGDGHCQCRPNIIGRNCDQVKPGYYLPLLDYNAYEGEFAQGDGDTRMIIREHYPGRQPTWTGPGFMRVTEGSTLEFTINDIIQDMYYDLVIRYEPQMGERWEDVRVTITRPGEPDQQGPCANSIPQDDFKATSLPPTNRFYVVAPSSCLERGVTYKIKLEFPRYRADKVTPDASILIDSIALLPKTDTIPIFLKIEASRAKQEFDHYRCRELLMSVIRPQLPEVCARLYLSISASIHQQAMDCQCDPMGSLSTECDPLGGQCKCKQNVVGRRCDQCSPGMWGFGPDGCQPCNCDQSGSVDNFCDISNGQCLCIANAYGQKCNECQKGFYNFPRCRRCECNGHAETCEDRTGNCQNCTDSTAGDHCDRCLKGYYGDPRIGLGLPCRECMCPGSQNSGYSHADTCTLDLVTQVVLCECEPGYVGDKCERCKENFYGNPLVPNGKCEACVCNNNIDFDMSGSCDSTTGECLKCLYNTEGFGCERCQDGYYGDATTQSCQACICDVLGTDQKAGSCDRVTGQCPCLPNVVGQSCDRCEVDHWKIASGEGCDACNCDPDGSLSSQCNQFDGQCRCKTGRGGRTCGDCETNYYGDPNVGCQECRCNRQGSATMQCNRNTGRCDCIVGVSGDKCDRCDRGTTGQLPFCVPCGECFDNWDEIIMTLRNQTNMLIEEIKNIKTTGAPGAFDSEFIEMEKKLDEIKAILANTNVSTSDVTDLELILRNIKENFTTTIEENEKVELKLADNTQSISDLNAKIRSLKNRIDMLKKSADDLRSNATEIRDKDVEGAYNSIKESQNRSRIAQDTVDGTDVVVGDSMDVRRETETILTTNKDGFDDKMKVNEEALDDVAANIDDMEKGIPDLNDKVCGNRGDPCDVLCGGALCKEGCGGALLCDSAAVMKSKGGKQFADDADVSLTKKDRDATTLLDNVEMAKDDSLRAKGAAQEAHDRCELAKNLSMQGVNDLQEMIDRITEFLGQKGAKPASIRTLAEEVLAMKISLSPDQIRDLAMQINDTIEGLTNIDAILEATKDDLNRAQSLKNRADTAKKDADSILNTAQGVSGALDDAMDAQDAAEAAIQNATQAISAAQGDLTMVETETDDAMNISMGSMNQVMDLKDRLEKLKAKFKINELNAQKAQQQANTSMELANNAKTDADALETKYGNAVKAIDAKYNMTLTARDRAKALRDRAEKLAQTTEDKTVRLKMIETEFGQNQKTLEDVSSMIEEMNRRMNIYLEDIQKKGDSYRICTP
ncbi:laminin subunit beta-1-like isoform X2 [Lineus longissimus]|uniref:laminin subunit beta-1-like isoform X2 n=1 Tax=Lineus longissimus TaxID=88925 RepID=UPI002B4DB3C3